MQISDEAAEAVRGNNKCMGALIQGFNKHYRTIENWLEEKNIILTTPDAVKIIKEHTGLDESKILIDEKALQ